MSSNNNIYKSSKVVSSDDSSEETFNLNEDFDDEYDQQEKRQPKRKQNVSNHSNKRRNTNRQSSEEPNQEEQEEEEYHPHLEEIICPAEAPDVFDLEAKIMSKTDNSDETIMFLGACGNEARRAVLFMEDKWLKFYEKRQHRGKSFETVAFDLFGMMHEDPVETLNQCVKSERKYMTALKTCLKTLNIIVGKDQKRISREELNASELMTMKLTRIENAIHVAKNSVTQALRIHKMVENEDDCGHVLIPDQENGKKNKKDKNKRSDFNELVRYFIEKAQISHLFGYKGAIYKEIKIEPDNISSHTFEKAMTMEEFIRDFIDPSDEIYDKFISHARVISDLAKGLTSIGEFPTIKPNRYLSAYKNGIFNCEKAEFYPWDSVTKDMVACRYHPNYFLYNVESLKGIALGDLSIERKEKEATRVQTTFSPPNPVNDKDGPTVHAWYNGQERNFHENVTDDLVDLGEDEIDFFKDGMEYFEKGYKRPKTYEEYDSWFDIPTPFFDKIMIHQKFDRNVMRWLYVMAGRLQFQLGKMDNWQIIAYLKGIAGTGKSTFLNICINLFDFQDVSVVSNNIERKFGLDPVSESYVWFCAEVKKDFGLSQAEWQSIVCGDPVSVACKNQKARVIPQWDVPGMMAGNELPGFVDSEGSFSRRVILWEFTQGVEDEADMGLSQYIRMEIPAIRYKITKAYLQAVQDHGKSRIMKAGILPAYFHKTNKNTKILSNSLVAFINDNDQVICAKDDPNCVWPFEKFKEAYDYYCKSQNFSRVAFNDSSETILKKHGIEKVHNLERQWNGNMLPKQCYLIGIKPIGMEE